MENKQTAVEFLIQELFNNGYFPYGVPEDIVNQAKEMEKEQIQSSYHTGVRYVLISQSDLALRRDKFPTPEQYYNEIYNSEQ